ncbi:Dehydrogenase [Aspergillus sp. HF37]|nr:Dehydrogenase [Aspergillus sp. HF37]
MRSVRFHGPRDIRVDEVDEPVCAEGHVKMRPAYVGICGTGKLMGPLDVYHTANDLVSQMCTTPVTLGHEFGGVIEEVGHGVTRVFPGQKAVVRPTIFDKRCCSCRLGYEYCCDCIGFIGLSGYGGGMSNHIVAPEEHFYCLPDHMSLESAALIEPLAVAWHAICVSPFKAGDNAVIIGGGPIGICLVQALKLKGAKSIIVAELLANRQRLALDYGATHIIDPKEVDVPSRVRGLTDTVGADIIFDTAGVERALNSAIHACRTHGTIVNIAVWERSPAIQVNQLMYHEVNYMGAALYDEQSFREVIEAMSTGQLNPEKMVTDKIKLDEVAEHGIEVLLNDRGGHCKILVDAQT